MDYKVCKKCGEKKPHNLTYFYKKLDYFSNYCKECTRLDNKKNYDKHSDKYLNQKKDYWNINKDKITEYRINNREMLLKANRKRINNKRKTDPFVRFKRRISEGIRRRIKSKGFIKNNNTCNIIGCTYKELLTHLEDSFELNYGLGRQYIKWDEVDIDHIIPISSATTEDEVIKLNHHSNLQLLFSEDNIDKSNKLDYNVP